MPEAAESFRGADGRVRSGWRVAIVSAVGLSVGPSVLQFMTLGVLTPYLRRAFGGGVSDLSLAATLLAVMTMAASSVQGLLVDRVGARLPIVLCLPLFGCGYAAMALMSGSLPQFYLAWALLPLLGVGLWPASWVKATSSWFEHRLGLAIGVATAGIGVGATLLPLAVHLLAETVGWRGAFAAVGLGSVVIAWPAAILHVREGTVGAGGGPFEPSPRSLPRVSTLPLLLAAFVLFGFYSIGILVHLVSVLVGNGASLTSAVAAQSVLGAFMVLGRLVSGYAVDLYPLRLVVAAFAGLSVLGLTVLAAGAIGTSAMAAAACGGLLIGAEIDVLGFSVKRYFGMRRYGTLYGLLFAGFQLGGAVGAFLIGRMREAEGDYVRGLATAAACCAIGALIFAMLGPYRFGETPPALGRGSSFERDTA